MINSMNIKIEPYDSYYTGLKRTLDKKVMVVGKKTTTTGALWWKNTTEEDVWCIMGSTGAHFCHVTCSSDYYWGVLKCFPYQSKDLAEKFYKELTGDENEIHAKQL